MSDGNPKTVTRRPEEMPSVPQKPNPKAWYTFRYSPFHARLIRDGQPTTLVKSEVTLYHPVRVGGRTSVAGLDGMSVVSPTVSSQTCWVDSQTSDSRFANFKHRFGNGVSFQNSPA